MLDITEFRKRMVHAATNGKETEFHKVAKFNEAVSPIWFVIGVICSIFALLPHGLMELGIATLDLNTSVITVILVLVLCSFLLSFILRKYELMHTKRRDAFMDFEYVLNLEEIDFLLWHRFEIKNKSYPVCVINVMLQHIERLEYINSTFILPLNGLDTK